jgi:hypothetical protein
MEKQLKESINPKASFKKIFYDKVFLGSVVGGLLLNFASWAVLFWGIGLSEAPVILHYNAFFGIDVVKFEIESNPLQLFENPINAGIIWLINFLGGVFIWKASASFEDEQTETERKKQKKKITEKGVDQFGAYLLWGGGFVVQAALLVYTVALAFINR